MKSIIEKLKPLVTNNKKQYIKEFFSGLDFNSEKHLYKHGDKRLKSVSSFIKGFVEPFDADRIAGYVAKGRGISKAEVLQEWENKKNFACDKGNRVHDYGENYANGLINKNEFNFVPTDGYERSVLAFWDSIPEYVQPFLMELQMFSKDLGLAGTADIILFNNRTGKFIIADYKTNIDLFKNYKGKKMLPPFNDLLDQPMSKYEIQLSIYQHLFEQSGFEVEQRKIIWLREDGTFETYNTPNHIEKVLKNI